jgi:hypothetical protein
MTSTPSTPSTIRTSIAALALVAVGLVATASGASADDGRLEVEGEIDANVAGQRWRWTLRHNGSVSDRGAATTTPRSGSFEVERRVVDLAGTDTLVFRAVRDGQVCRGVVNY